MLTGFELFLMKAPAEVEPLFSFTQDVSAARPIPVRLLHGDHAIIGGTSRGQVNIWDVFSRLKQSLRIGGESPSVFPLQYTRSSQYFYSRRLRICHCGKPIFVLLHTRLQIFPCLGQAHYDPTSDNFLVATGTFNHGTASPVLVWQAKETRE